jgi:predicted SAM-dependent methyltransferase/glycosyltransferase involved in cell wall biosynthesis
MKIALLFGPFSVATRPLNFFGNNIWISERGLSGSDLGVVVTAQKLAKLGHDVSLFTFHVPGTKPAEWEGVKLYHYEDRLTVIDQSFDAMVSWNEPDVFRGLPTNKVRICQQMLNDFGYCQSGFDDLVDIWTSPSDMHCQWLQKYLPSNKWRILPLGSEPTWFTPTPKVPGSVSWISSPDRGLHLLLQEWPNIKKMVPDATLKVFYHINDIPDQCVELSRRVKYIKYALNKLNDYGVQHVGSVSRQQIAEELSKTMVMVAPLSTVSPTEGFSVSTIEALTAGCLPIVGNIDCLGSIYGRVACMIPAPVEQHLSDLMTSVVRGLTDEKWRTQIVDHCQEFAKQYTWDKNVEKLVTMIETHPKYSPQNVGSTSLVKLNIGAGPNVFPFPGWINYDREDLSGYFQSLHSREVSQEPIAYVQNIIKYLKSGNSFDLRIRDLRQGFPLHPDNSVDLIYFGQVIEHLNPIFEAPKFLEECYRMLRPGGVLRMTTPDLDLLIQAYQNGEMEKFASEQPDFYRHADPSAQLSYIMFGACGYRCTRDYYEGHMHLYTQKSMTTLLQQAKFRSITFYYQKGQSLSPIMNKEVVDQGMTHSFIVEAMK